MLLPGLLRTTRMEQRERAQTTELVYGTLRRRRSLDALLEPVLDRDLARRRVRSGQRNGAAPR
ncbi:MAG: transcription antitermination factor NusB [Acidimicrobiia bacterium]